MPDRWMIEEGLMSEEQAENEQQVEFIDAHADAAIRLECFRLAKPLGANNMGDQLAKAKALYNWIMDFEESEDDDVAETELATESAPACTRKQ